MDSFAQCLFLKNDYNIQSSIERPRSVTTSIFMKIFAIYLRLNLIQRPLWFEDFRLKYDEPFDLHVTLIQPRYVNEQQVDDLKSKITQFLDEHKLISEDKVVEFNKLVYDQEQDGTYTLMLLAEKADKLSELQKGLRELLKEFAEYVDKVTIEYEENFRPHITIGRNIKTDSLRDAKLYFESSFLVKGILTDLVLPVVKDTSIEERKNPNNLTILDL